MARSRNIKPGLFKNEILGEEDPILTLLFIGLWCLADREGRLEDRPKRIKAEIFPYREIPDFNGYLTQLVSLGFIQRYTAKNQPVIEVLNFKKHQSPHKTEKPSELPENPDSSTSCPVTDKEPLNNESLNVKESLIPDSLIPDSRSKGRTRKTKFSPPTVDEVIQFFTDNGYTAEAGRKAHDYYADGDWKDSAGKPVKSWKQKMRGVWFKPENEAKEAEEKPWNATSSGIEAKAKELGLAQGTDEPFDIFRSRVEHKAREAA